MKIGAFAKKTETPVSTIRYYISEELISPDKNGAQYDFDDENIKEMQLLTELRQMNFTMEEMRRFVNVVRMLDSKDALRYRHLLSILSEKQDSLNKYMRTLKKVSRQIEVKISQLKLEESVMAHRERGEGEEGPAGMPAEFLDMLRCPECGERISLDNASIRNGGVVYGEIICRCGYTGRIEDGIVNVDPDINPDDDPVFIDDYFGEDSVNDQNFSLQYEGFLTARPDFLMIQHKTRDWIHRKILEKSPGSDVIVFPDIASLFLYLHVDADYLQNARIIVMGISRKGIEANRRHLEALDSNLKVMYVLTPSNRLPIEKKSVNLMVDYLGTFNYAFFYDRQLYEYLNDYFDFHVEGEAHEIHAFFAGRKEGSENVHDKKGASGLRRGDGGGFGSV